MGHGGPRTLPYADELVLQRRTRHCLGWAKLPDKRDGGDGNANFLPLYLVLLPRVVYDVARRDTFENLDLWLQEVEVYSPAGGRDVVKLLVGNKIDKVRCSPQRKLLRAVKSNRYGLSSRILWQDRIVSRREAEDWARSKGMLFVESSAKTKIGIQQVFNEVVQKVRCNAWTHCCGLCFY